MCGVDVLFASVTAVLFGALTVAIGIGLRRGSAELGTVTVSLVAFPFATAVTTVGVMVGGLGRTDGLWRLR